jgi:flagellar biosynthesis/type III secretory pathway M-ring protein FliF/YscJ
MAESQLTKEEKEYELHNVETTVAEKPKRFADYIKNLANNG